ncbi:MAG: 16S rRNA (adenine(1518)-N(6)/adenine(1519)-N(6))-dimethyltransferase RsmA [Gammaproteobacteria bacterium]|nr:16S rRNA (adenine(1518)-N(6)/adenine(1519)-N(6))-dimethyltransferase RsmA [Gammaproteobacteria bacterium]
MSDHRAKKRFGQHFLHDPSAIDRIIGAVNPQPGENLIEIGPGLGAITTHLLEKAQTLHVVELDRDVIPHLQEKCRGVGELVVHQGDALKFDFGTLADEIGSPLRLVGNLPYNVSSPLLFHFLKYRAVIRDMHFMLQKEVVDRMAAPPGSKTYGRLSVMLAADCRITPLFTIRPGAFNPPPKVDSAVVRLQVLDEPAFPLPDRALFQKVVTQAFSQRRKTLRNTLKGLIDADTIAACGIDPGLRPEAIAPADFGCLAAALAGHEAG